jgi:TrmH family RNA methyltransferase
LRDGAPVHQAIVSPRLLRDPAGRALLGRLESAGVKIGRASDALMDGLAPAQAHQGILLLVDRPERGLGDFIASGPSRGTVLVACGVQDPGNLGALVRVADACGARGLLAAGGADPFGPKAVRASAGSLFRVAVAREPDPASLPAWIAVLRSGGLAPLGAVSRGGVDYRDADLARPFALFVGSEGGGLPPQITGALDGLLTIPLRGRVESINVTSAAAVILFEALRQRRAAGARPR